MSPKILNFYIIVNILQCNLINDFTAKASKNKENNNIKPMQNYF